jgi:threonyl-tRNA synthetase
MPREPIKITLPDGTVKEGISYETSPFSIALGISKSLVEKTVISKVRYGLFLVSRKSLTDFPFLQVNGQLWDLERPFEGDASLELLDFEHPEGTHFSSSFLFFVT